MVMSIFFGWIFCCIHFFSFLLLSLSLSFSSVFCAFLSLSLSVALFPCVLPFLVSVLVHADGGPKQITVLGYD